MALTINSNIASLISQRNLQSSTRSINKSFGRLSSGLRVSSSTDDAAGLSIATGLTSQIRGMNQAIRNTNDAISLIQVAEGAMDETTNSLQRIRELAVQASSDTYTSTDRGDIWEEVVQLLSEINRIASTTTFNGKTLLNGNFSGATSGMRFTIGAEAGQTIALNIDAIAASNLGIGADSIIGSTDYANLEASGIETFYMGGGRGTSQGFSNAGQVSLANYVVGLVDSALASVSDIRSGLGSVQNRLESTISSLANVSENTQAARSRIIDVDIATETSNLTRQSILQQAGTAILAQANQQPQLALLLLGG
ncbi:flagellin N-terminal helical domain-containing protein [Magnetococcales bacterium HHB-1]